MQTLPYVMCTALGALVGAGVPWCVLRIWEHPSRLWEHTAWPYWLCSLAGGALAWVCAAAAAPELGRNALLYGGLGAVLGQGTAWRGRGGQAVCGLVCAWVALYLPFTGMLACLGALALALALDCPQLGLVAAPVFAAPVALLQFGAPGALAMLAGAAVSFERCGRKQWLRRWHKSIRT